MYTCEVCNKSFFKRGNFNRHVARHKDTTQHQCDICGKVFAHPFHLIRHKRMQHSVLQVGYGETEDGEPEPKRAKITDARNVEDIRDLYSISRVKEVHMKKFNTKGLEYNVAFKDNLDIYNHAAILDTLHRVFDSLFETLTQGAGSKDLVRVVVMSPELDYPIQLPFITKDKLTAERFLARIEQVIQSNEQFSLDSSLQINITHVTMPLGGKTTKKRYVNFERFLKEKRCIIQIINKDHLCCARAIVTAKAKIDAHEQWDSIRRGCSLQQTLAEDLHRQAGVPLNKCGVEEIKLFQGVLSGYQILVASKEHFNGIIYKGPPADKQIYLYFHHGHYDVITKMPAFLNRSYFCVSCLKGYDHAEDHRCKHSCKLCFQNNCVEEDWLYCHDCNRHFKSKTCFENHLKQNGVGNSVCKTHYRCQNCSQFISRKRHREKKHVCGEKYCSVCREYVDQDHLCFMQPAMKTGARVPTNDCQVKDSQNNDKDGKEDAETNDKIGSYLFFDFECMQETGIHEPNLCIARKVCERCLDREVVTCQQCGDRERVFDGPNTQNEFCEWLFGEENAGSIVVCHNFQGYDSYFILHYLYDNAVLPQVIQNGSKIMSIEVSANDMKFLDSLNFLPVSLSKLPGAFGLKELAKGYFPHFFNIKANQNKVLSHLPDMKYYNPAAMKPAERQKLIDWYQLHQHDVFNFKHEIVKYCRSDVDILRRCCLRFRALFMDMTADENTQGIDPFQQCITIASACNLAYRTKYLDPETIGIIHPMGYRSNDRQSVKALQWLKWMSHQTGQYIKHAANGGEMHIGKYKVDGYYEADGDKVALEFHGCLHHGHTCMARTAKHPFNNLTMEELFQKTLEKRLFITKQGYRYTEQWECEFDAQLKKDVTMRDYISAMQIPTPLVPRDAFCGGRTNATRLFYEAGPGEKIRYVDFTSLYPYINKYGKYPIGHPTIITENFRDIKEYEGLVKCTVLPPRGLYHPVLPYKAAGRLMFPLCAQCSQSLQQTPCSYNDEERALTGTWVTMELQKALQMDYKLVNIHEVWHFDQFAQYDPDTKEGGLFAAYVNAFLKMKQEASDWPSWCETDEQKHDYIQSYSNREGVQLEWGNIQKNPGLRALAKLMLNSFWGKFGQRPNMAKTSHITDAAEYFEMLTSDDVQVNSANFVSEEMVEVTWQRTDDFVEPSGRTNVVIAAYTTAQAGLKLYELLEQLGRRVLYYDTDSVIYVSREGEWEPKIGDYLGELTNEIDEDNHITSFVSGGPKNYAYKLVKPDASGNTTFCKVRGVTLNYRNQSIVNFNTMFQMVHKVGPTKVQVVDPHKITRNKKTMHIETKEQRKNYQVMYTKRMQVDGFDTLPYGY